MKITITIACIFCLGLVSCNSYLSQCGQRSQNNFITEQESINKELQLENYSIHDTTQYPLKIRIPVVFHVLYRDNSMKVKKEHLIDEITMLNNNFSGNNPDLYEVVPDEFKDRIGKTDIEFYLAEVDPFGNPSDGIIYKKTRRKFFSFSRPIFYADKIWNPQKYMNVYVGNVRVNAFYDTSGYVDHPNIWESPKKDAIAVSYELLGKGNK